MKYTMKTTKLLLASAVFASMLLAGCGKNGGEDEPKTYTVTVTSGDNGTAVADKTTATEGATVTLTATPDPGYGFVKWTVESGGVELSGTTAATATFTMPAANVSVKAEFIVGGVLINGTIWALCNVGAPGTFAAKPEDAGMFYQWNRKIGWSSTDPLVNSAGGTTWNITKAEGEEWAAVNDPCPEGWRVPTYEEQVDLCDDAKTTYEWIAVNEINGGRITDNESGNSVFFPASGNRHSVSGAVNNNGMYGFYWAAVPSTVDNGRYLAFSSVAANPQNSGSRATGFSVRCVAE